MIKFNTKNELKALALQKAQEIEILKTSNYIATTQMKINELAILGIFEYKGIITNRDTQVNFDTVIKFFQSLGYKTSKTESKETDNYGVTGTINHILISWK